MAALTVNVVVVHHAHERGGLLHEVLEHREVVQFVDEGDVRAPSQGARQFAFLPAPAPLEAVAEALVSLAGQLAMDEPQLDAARSQALAEPADGGLGAAEVAEALVHEQDPHSAAASCGGELLLETTARRQD